MIDNICVTLQAIRIKQNSNHIILIELMKKNVYAVSGMKCVHCKANVENALKALNGVVSAEANLEEANVTVEYDESKVNPSEIKEAVDNSGRYELSL